MWSKNFLKDPQKTVFLRFILSIFPSSLWNYKILLESFVSFCEVFVKLVTWKTKRFYLQSQTGSIRFYL